MQKIRLLPIQDHQRRGSHRFWRRTGGIEVGLGRRIIRGRIVVTPGHQRQHRLLQIRGLVPS